MQTFTLRQISGIIKATWARHNEAIDEGLAEAGKIPDGLLRYIQENLLQRQRANSDWLKKDLRLGFGLNTGDENGEKDGDEGENPA
jgi:hypothetical protein